MKRHLKKWACRPANMMRYKHTVSSGARSAVPGIDSTRGMARRRLDVNMVRPLRKARKISFQDMSYRTGIPVVTIREIEAQKNMAIAARMIEAIARELQLPVASLGFNPIRCRCYPHILKIMRVRSDMQLEPAADMADVSPDQLQKYEQNDYIDMALYTCKRLAEIYNASEETLRHYYTVYAFTRGDESFYSRIVDA